VESAIIKINFFKKYLPNKNQTACEKYFRNILGVPEKI